MAPSSGIAMTDSGEETEKASERSTYSARDSCKAPNQPQKLILLSLTSRCALGCVYCRGSERPYDRLGAGSHRGDFPRERWDWLISVCRRYASPNLLLTGGEPLQYPELADLLERLALEDIPVRIHSNGVHAEWNRLLKRIDRMADRRLGVTLSLELVDELQQRLRCSSLPLALVEELAARDLNLQLKVVLHNELLPWVEVLPEVLREWRSRGVSSVRFQTLAPAGQAALARLRLDRSCLRLVDTLSELDIAYPDLAGLVRNSPEHWRLLRALLTNSLPAERASIEACQVARTLLFMNSSGEEMTCRSLWQRPEGVPCSEFFDETCSGFQS